MTHNQDQWLCTECGNRTLTVQRIYDDYETVAMCRTLESATAHAEMHLERMAVPMEKASLADWEKAEGERAYWRSVDDILSKTVRITEHAIKD